MQGDDAQSLYAIKAEEIVPNIRYCNYNLGDETAKKDLMDLKLKSATGSELAEKIDVCLVIQRILKSILKQFNRTAMKIDHVLRIINSIPF